MESSSCVDQIFTPQPDLITVSGGRPSLHANSHHQIIFAEFNEEILYPPIYFLTRDTTKIQIKILSDEHLIFLIGTEFS